MYNIVSFIFTIHYEGMLCSLSYTSTLMGYGCGI